MQNVAKNIHNSDGGIMMGLVMFITTMILKIDIVDLNFD